MSSGEISKVPERVLYVIGSLGVGGAERHVVAVATALRRRGWHTGVFALQPQGPLLSALTAAGVPVKGPTVSPWLVALLGERLSAWFRLILAVAMLAPELLRHRRRVLHFFLPAAYILGGLVACLVGAHPRIMSRRSLNRYQLKHPLYRKVERFLHPRMDILVGNSLAVVRELEDESKGKTPIRLIYNGIDAMVAKAGDRDRVRRELELGEEALVMVVVANLIPYKGHADLLLALAHVSNRLPAGWRLLCVGRDDGIGHFLQDTARTLGIDANLSWMGARMDVPDFLAAADMAISASHEEGFSNAVLEAMLAGLPMVVTDVGGNPEAVVDGVTGYVVPARNPVKMGQAILNLADETRRLEMGACGRARAIETFSMAACLDGYEALYRESQIA